MKVIKCFLLFHVIFILLMNAAYAMSTNAEELYPFHNKNQMQRFAQLSYETRCVVCQNQNLAESNAPMATDLRNKIYHMILEGKSDVEIKTYLLQRYGDFILFNPPLTPKTMLLWWTPALLLACVIFLIRKRVRFR